MKYTRASLAGLAAVALLLAACSPGGSTPAADAPSSGPRVTSAVVNAPPAPTDFVATPKTGSVPCPSADGSCLQTDFVWQSTADSGAWFKIYESSFGLDPEGTCAGVQADAKSVLETKPAVRAAKLLQPMAVGGGKGCFWITAVNSAGESAQVPAAGN